MSPWYRSSLTRRVPVVDLYLNFLAVSVGTVLANELRSLLGSRKPFNRPGDVIAHEGPRLFCDALLVWRRRYWGTSISGWCLMTQSAIRRPRAAMKSSTFSRYVTYSSVVAGVPERLKLSNGR